jgi:recombination protein RecA
MGETRIGQGKDAAKQYLKDNPEVAEKLEAEIRANAYKLMGKQVSPKAAEKASRTAAPGEAPNVSADDFEDD